MKAFVNLVWIESKIFLREPLGVLGTLGIPVLLFLVFGRALTRAGAAKPELLAFAGERLPILAVLVLMIGTTLSLVAILAIYREGGILRRLKATPLRPLTILSAHVTVKILMSLLTFAVLVLAGRRLALWKEGVHFPSFVAALLLSLLAIISIGFVLASIVRTARFAQPVSSAVLYTLMVLSGLFTPLEKFPDPLRWALLASPVTHATRLLSGIWEGGVFLDYPGSIAALVASWALWSLVASRLFRWE